MKVNGQWVPCVHNSSNSFIPILLKLYRCIDHALKMCMWFGYNRQINFDTFFRNLNFVVFRAFALGKCMWFRYTLFSDYIEYITYHDLKPGSDASFNAFVHLMNPATAEETKYVCEFITMSLVLR